MEQSHNPPENPAGVFTASEQFDPGERDRCIETIRLAPSQLRDAIQGLTDSQLDTKYRNWTIRQITHHIADSHLNSLVRFKWALTEDSPVIKAYEEADWVQLDDSRTGCIEPALELLAGIHSKWVQLLRCMMEEQFGRTFQHPQSGETVSLWTALNSYAWHGQHHTAQILWVRRQHGW